MSDLTELIKTKAREAEKLAQASQRLPWWHRKRRRLMRRADKKMREVFELLVNGKGGER